LDSALTDAAAVAWDFAKDLICSPDVNEMQNIANMANNGRVKVLIVCFNILLFLSILKKNYYNCKV